MKKRSLQKKHCGLLVWMKEWMFESKSYKNETKIEELQQKKTENLKYLSVEQNKKWWESVRERKKNEWVINIVRRERKLASEWNKVI